jgi:tetratricopeptide (TPR) repeat protein
MKAEESKLEENELAASLSRAWASLKSGSGVTVTVIAILGIVIAVSIGWSSYSSSKAAKAAKLWTELDQLPDLLALREFLKKNPEGMPGRTARFQLARALMGPEGIDKVGTSDETARNRAVECIEEAKGLYIKLAAEAKSEPLLASEALLAIGKAEEILLSVAKVPGSSESRGSLEKAIEYYTKVQNQYPNTPAKLEAAKRLKDLQDYPKDVTDFYTELAKDYGPKKPVEFPKFDIRPTEPTPAKKDEPKAEVKKDEPKAAEPVKKDEAKTPEPVKKDEPKAADPAKK